VVNKDPPRIPQDLTSFAAAGTITQAMLDDPNTLLRNHIASQNITSTMNFNHLSWPHVSVATLVPASPVPVPPSAWA
jgi:hypothetical protein